MRELAGDGIAKSVSEARIGVGTLRVEWKYCDQRRLVGRIRSRTPQRTTAEGECDDEQHRQHGESPTRARYRTTEADARRIVERRQQFRTRRRSLRLDRKS